MKNIAIIIDGLTGGGAEKVMLTLASALIKNGHRVSLLSLGGKRDYPIPKGLEFDVLFSGKISTIDRFWRIKNSVNKLESWFFNLQKRVGHVDLVLSNLDKSNNLLANSSIKNVFYIIHNSVEQELQRQRKLGPFAYWSLKKTKQNLSGKNLICVSKGLKTEIEHGLLIEPASIKTIYNPIDVDAITAQSLVDNNDIPNTPYLIHVGRFARQKRHDLLFEAFSQLDSGYKLVLLCNKPDKARRLARKYHIEDRLVLPGFQANPYNWIKQAEALILSSDYEGLSMVLLEALAVATKVVSTDCPHGPSEILTGELARFLVPIGDPKAMASAISDALSSDFHCETMPILKQVDAGVVVQQYVDLCS